jgi:hypothetical protein
MILTCHLLDLGDLVVKKFVCLSFLSKIMSEFVLYSQLSEDNKTARPTLNHRVGVPTMITIDRRDGYRKSRLEKDEYWKHLRILEALLHVWTNRWARRHCLGVHVCLAALTMEMIVE